MSHGTSDHLQLPRKQWWFVLAFGLLTLICGAIGQWQYDLAKENHGHAPSALYHALQMLILHTPHFGKDLNGWIEAGRWFGVLTFFTATAALLWKRLSREVRLFLVSQWTDHYVVCGLGEKGFGISCCLSKQHPNCGVVVVDPHPDPYLADKCDQQNICVITADATQAQALQQARIATAREVIVITPTDEINVRIATEVRAQRSAQKAGAAPCHVHLSDIHLREALQQWSEPANQKDACCVLHFFDVFDDEARRVLLELPIDGRGIAQDDPRSVHVAILGFGRMGRSLALRAAKMGHFANAKPLRISIIDRNAELQRERFFFRYPILKSPAVCKMEFVACEVESLAARECVERWACEPDTLLHVFVALDDDTRAVEVALRLKAILQRRPDRTLRVRVRSNKSLAQIVEASGSANFDVKAFGMVEDACTTISFRQEHNEALARAIHEDFVAKRVTGSQRRPENDPALGTWEAVREDIRESNRQQADHIAIKLRAIGCELAEASKPGEPVEKFEWKEIEPLAPVEHERWNAERWLAGWRYGTPSNKDQRISENLVPWDELHPSIQKYDEEAIAAIPELLKRASPPLKVVRVVSSKR